MKNFGFVAPKSGNAPSPLAQLKDVAFPAMVKNHEPGTGTFAAVKGEKQVKSLVPKPQKPKV